MVTKKFGSNDHEALQSRAEHCVCKQCGGQLTTTLVIYDIYGGVGEELYCPHCQKKEFGVEKEIYDLAQYYVEHFQFNYFYDMEENDVNVQLNIAKVADMMSWLFKNVDLLNNEGLKNTVPDYRYFENKRKNK